MTSTTVSPAAVRFTAGGGVGELGAMTDAIETETIVVAVLAEMGGINIVDSTAAPVAGVSLSLFSLFCKRDAYRVIKDFAWYWGDFFFLVEQKLSFERVFNMAPHPMYTLGYLHYYGAALLSGSHLVIFVSVAGVVAEEGLLEVAFMGDHVDHFVAGRDLDHRIE